MKRVTKYLDSISTIAAFEKHAIMSLMFCFALFAVNKLADYLQHWYMSYVYIFATLLGLHLLLVIAKRLGIKIFRNQ